MGSASLPACVGGSSLELSWSSSELSVETSWGLSGRETDLGETGEVCWLVELEFVGSSSSEVRSINHSVFSAE